MSRYSQRSRSSPSRGLIVLLLIIGGLVGAAFWIGPFRAIPAELQLLVQDGDTLARAAAVRNAGDAGEPRFPLVLGLANAGGRVAAPVRVDVSVPAMFRLRSNAADLQRESIPGNPLVRYQVPIVPRAVAPNGEPQLLGVGDTLWLEPILDAYYCTTLADSIPEFVPSPARDPQQLARVQVFYSFVEENAPLRQTGLLQLQLDPAALQQTPAPMPPSFPVQVREPELPRPELGTLVKAGERAAECGDPQQPLELYTVTWETPGRGRFLVVYVSGAPRKQLFDLNRDSIIELEMWDPDADGRFEAARPARYAIPSFLLPERVAEEVVAVDSLLNDPQWQRLFGDTLAGPFRFVPDSALPPALKPKRVVTDSAWLQQFHNVEAGPYRFAENPPERLVKPEPPRPRRTGPVPLGRPVPYPVPPGRPDTIR